jgi:hypothetical protein
MHKSRVYQLLLVAAIASGAASAAMAQMERLPPTDAVEEGPPVTVFSSSDVPVERLPPVVEEAAAGDDSSSSLPRDVRPGVFQKLIFEETWLPRFGSQGFGMNDVGLKMVLGLPCPTVDSPLIVTPGYMVHYLDGPETPDLPPQVYDAFVEFRWLHRFTPQWGVDLDVAPGYYSDYQQSDSRAWRFTGHAIVAWTWTPLATVVLGAAYEQRTQTPLIPVGGLIWNPNDDTKFNLVFPEPKISRRIRWRRDGNADFEDWVYVAGEFANDTWTVLQPGLSSDLLTYRDIRAMLGYEHKVFGGISSKVEVGYVFSRKLQLTDQSINLDPTSTLMLRGGLTY